MTNDRMRSCPVGRKMSPQLCRACVRVRYQVTAHVLTPIPLGGLDVHATYSLAAGTWAGRTPRAPSHHAHLHPFRALRPAAPARGRPPYLGGYPNPIPVIVFRSPVSAHCSRVELTEALDPEAFEVRQQVTCTCELLRIAAHDALAALAVLGDEASARKSRSTELAVQRTWRATPFGRATECPLLSPSS